MGRLGNVVVLNGKSYSVDTGELINSSSVTGIKAAEKASKTQVEAIKRLTQSAPAKNKPTLVERHPNHTDLSQAGRARKIEVKSATVNAKAADPLSHKYHQSSTKLRPKSLKSHRPATKVHSKVKVSQSINRVQAPNSPRISHVSHMNRAKSDAAVSTQKMDLGISQSESRRLRAAQHRRNEQISKFAAARRQKQVQVEVATKSPPAAVEPVPTVKVNATHAPVRSRIASANAPVAAAVAAHHPRQKTVSEIIPTMQEPVSAASKSAPQIKQLDHGKADRFGLTGFAPAAAISVTVIAMVAYMTYLNVPNLAMRVAASRAGFDANLPAYTPNGFAFDGPIAYNSGQVVVDFTSNTDNRAYTVAQRKSNWNSESLLQNVVKQETENYLTFQDKGLTIYVYDGNNATWMNGGVWYTIKGDGSKLNSDQLVRIATSL